MHRHEFQRAAKLFRAGRLTLDQFAAQVLGGGSAVRTTTAVDDSNNRAELVEGVTLDLQRFERCGFPEVIFGEGKTTETICHAVARLLQAGQPVLVTRIEPAAARVLCEAHPEGVHHRRARTFRCGVCHNTGDRRAVAVVTAGTADQPVAEEAIETLAWAGVQSYRAFDVGVAGPQRLAGHLERIRGCRAVIVVAGMDGVLPSVVAGHVAAPVIAVPTSTGYGLNLDGLSAALTMLNACAPNVSIVNIDGGFRAAYLAAVMGLAPDRTHQSSVADARLAPNRK